MRHALVPEHVRGLQLQPDVGDDPAAAAFQPPDWATPQPPGESFVCRRWLERKTAGSS